jgi:hypothetical protein
MKSITMVVLMLAMMTGCSNKEQVYEGLYKGLGTAEQNRQTTNPSYDPVEAQQEQLGYQEYKRERDEGIKNN